MELRKFAEIVLFSENIEDKIRPVAEAFSDDAPGDSILVDQPVRPANLQFAARRTAPSMPKPGGFRLEHKRGLAHHILANHELQALEVMAYMLIRFPDAHSTFRLGMARVMQDEQRHTRMHIERAAVLGVTFGDFPVNSYIWEKAQAFESLLDYLATLPLLFEGRNLDHTIEFANLFRNAGDDRSAALMEVIHRDEIEHVAFGIEWLRRLKPDNASDWDTFSRHLKWPLRPSKAKGEQFQIEARRAAGLTDDFIELLNSETDDNVEIRDHLGQE